MSHTYRSSAMSLREVEVLEGLVRQDGEKGLCERRIAVDWRV